MCPVTPGTEAPRHRGRSDTEAGPSDSTDTLIFLKSRAVFQISPFILFPSQGGE